MCERILVRTKQSTSEQPLFILPASSADTARRRARPMDVPGQDDVAGKDEADFDELARQQAHALRSEFARRLGDIRAGSRMRKATSATQPEKAAMAMESAATKWAAAPKPARPARAETPPSEAEEVELEPAAPLPAKLSKAQRRKAKAKAAQAVDGSSVLRQPTVCEADVLETIATVRRSNVAASVSIHGWVVALKIRAGGESRPAPRHDLEVRAPGASDKWSGRLRSVDAVKRAMGLLPGATPLELEAIGRWDKGPERQEGGEPRTVDARGVRQRATAPADGSDGDDQ
eukprot:scaffold112345_cov60-Phaeocystis_antarctica.AAC.1